METNFMKQQKRIAIIGTVGLPARYGGFETLTEHLVRQLGHRYQLSVYCSSKKYPKGARPAVYRNARLHYLPLEANGIQSIPYDTLSILHALWYADVLVILGVAGAWLLPFIRLFTRKRIIISIDGIEWKRDKWNRLARWYLWWAEKIAVNFSHADIADNESIQDYTAVRYGSLSSIIEYGADHTLQVSPQAGDKEKYPFLGKPYACKVCRIEPENNVHVVLDAFARTPQHTLVVIGNWKNSVYGSSLRDQYSGFSNLILLDPVYNQRELDLIRGNAFLYVHGHSAGGTNPSLVEAMYLGLPVMAFDVSYNRTTTEQKARYFRDANSLLEQIQQVRMTDWKSNGGMMKEIANRRYTWPVIAGKYAYLIEQVCALRKKQVIVPVSSATSSEKLMDLGLLHLQHPSMFYEKR
jgi:glycosyltransferase involved in cell wall biosynthesis